MPGSILILCPFPVGSAAGQRLKYEQYVDDWRARGHRVDILPFMDDALWQVVHRPGHLIGKTTGTLRGLIRRRSQLDAVSRYDLVYLFQWATPVGSSNMERQVRRRAARLIYDLEDNLFSPDKTAKDAIASPLLRWLRGRDKPRFLVEQADHVIASSPELADYCRTLNRRGAATYISSSVDTDRFVPVNRGDGGPVTIGWTGTLSTRTYLDLLRPVFAGLSRTRQFRLRVIGNFDYDLPGVHLEVLRWSEAEEVAQLQGIDIGVYPLPLDEWVSGKSGLKAIQYMAFGIPTVASDAGNTPRIIRDGENGLLVRNDDEWVTALERLIDDAALRRRLGEQARRDCVQNYSIKAVAADYRRVIDEVMALPPANKR
jgi:L-malate glycosyltransferase